jgi:hypothetical protein
MASSKLQIIVHTKKKKGRRKTQRTGESKGLFLSPDQKGLSVKF